MTKCLHNDNNEGNMVFSSFLSCFTFMLRNRKIVYFDRSANFSKWHFHILIFTLSWLTFKRIVLTLGCTYQSIDSLNDLTFGLNLFGFFTKPHDWKKKQNIIISNRQINLAISHRKQTPEVKLAVRGHNLSQFLSQVIMTIRLDDL